jgi:SAM-dependent methyltransferase
VRLSDHVEQTITVTGSTRELGFVRLPHRWQTPPAGVGCDRLESSRRTCAPSTDAANMSADLEFTGERYVPGTAGEIAHEHWHRYAFARAFVAGRRVLDVACGEGYGSALLADAAVHVTGVDIDARTLAHARATYAGHTNVEFVEGSAAKLPLPDASVDVVVSFETIEHLQAADQPRMLAEFAWRAASGRRTGPVVTQPPRVHRRAHHVNPFHIHELDRDELARLVDPLFPAQRWHRQRRYLGSALWSEENNGRYDATVGDAAAAFAAPLPAAMYFVVVAARSTAALPAAFPALSLFTDSNDAELGCASTTRREALGSRVVAHVRRGTARLRPALAQLGVVRIATIGSAKRPRWPSCGPANRLQEREPAARDRRLGRISLPRAAGGAGARDSRAALRNRIHTPSTRGGAAVDIIMPTTTRRRCPALRHARRMHAGRAPARPDRRRVD